MAKKNVTDDENLEKKDDTSEVEVEETETVEVIDEEEGDDGDEQEAEDPLAEIKDQMLRQRAEFENFRKRSEKEKSQMFEMGSKNVVEKILPVVDNFERGLAGCEDSDDAFVTGMQAIYKQLLGALDELGVKPIDALDKEFDPNLHNAVMHVDDDSYGENVVIEELQKGYTLGESVIRHSMVKVAN